MWNGARLRKVKGSERVVEAARIMRVEFEVVGDVTGQRMVVYGGYMPVRTSMTDVGEVRRVWTTLTDAVMCETQDTWVIGDVNAETARYIAHRRRGARRIQEADVQFARMLRLAKLQVTAQGRPTHRAGGEIDHILAPERVGCRAGRSRIEPGVGRRGGDHMTIWSTFTTQVSREGCGPNRPMGPRVQKLRASDWEAWRSNVRVAVHEALELCGDGGVARAETIQRVTLATLEEMIDSVRERRRKEAQGGREAEAADIRRQAQALPTSFPRSHAPRAPPLDGRLTLALSTQ